MNQSIMKRRGFRGLLKTVGAGVGAVALIGVTATGAYAGTPSSTNGTATLTASHTDLSTNSGYTNVSGTSLTSGTVSSVAVSGTGYSGYADIGGTGSAVGVYVVYGPKEATFNTNSGWYNSFAYVPESAFSSTGGWSGVTLNLERSYTADPFHDDAGLTVDCGYNWSNPSDPANATKKKCYIQTFTAHGQPLNPQDELTIEVRWP